MNNLQCEATEFYKVAIYFIKIVTGILLLSFWVVGFLVLVHLLIKPDLAKFKEILLIGTLLIITCGYLHVFFRRPISVILVEDKIIYKLFFGVNLKFKKCQVANYKITLGDNGLLIKMKDKSKFKSFGYFRIAIPHFKQDPNYDDFKKTIIELSKENSQLSHSELYGKQEIKLKQLPKLKIKLSKKLC